MESSDRPQGPDNPPGAGAETGPETRPEAREDPAPAQGTYWAAVAALVILVGIVGFALVRRNDPVAPASEVISIEDPIPASTIVATLPDALSPESRIIVERYRCVCGCNDPLSTCTCANTPGSQEMKSHLEALVAGGKSSGDIDRAMIDRYGPRVLLSEPVGGGS